MAIKLQGLDKVEAWSAGGMLPVGQHAVRIESATEGVSSGGHDQVEIEFVSTNNSGAIRDWLVFTEATLGKARALLDAVGIEIKGGEFAFPTADLVDKTLVIHVGEEPDYKDVTKMRRRVQGYAPIGSEETTANGKRDEIPF